MRREFTGYDTDIESGLQYAGARYYDPSQARFLSMDPAGQFQSPYAYTGWDPVNMTDPTGTVGGWISAFIGFAAAGVMQLFRTILMGTEGSWGDFGRGVVNAHTKGVTSDLIGLGGIGPTAGYAAFQGASATEAARAGLGTKFSIAASAYALTQAKSKNQTALAGVGLAVAVGSVIYTVASYAQRKTAVEVQERGTLSGGDYQSAANAGSGNYSPDSTYVLPEGMTPDEARSMIAAQRAEGVGFERSGPIRGSGADVHASGYKDGQFGTIHSRYGFIGANAGTIPFIGGPGGLLARGALRILGNPSTRPLLTGTVVNSNRFIRFGLGKGVGGNGVIRFSFGSSGRHIDLVNLGRIPKGGF